MADGTCVWMYAVAADAAEPAGTGATGTGVGGGRVRTVSGAGLVAIVEDVNEREFGAVALRRNLEDLNWLEQTARAHHAVINAAGARRPVVPMRLATVYTCDESVTETLRDRAADLREALSRIGGRREWGVKAFTAGPGPASGGPDGGAGAGPSAASGGTDGGAGAGPGGPGAAYLRRRRAQLTAHQTARHEAVSSAQAIFAELRRLAVAARLYPLQSPDLTGQRAAMVLNAAYLVTDAHAERFAAAVNDLTGRHRSVRLALTGPWPAYSFAGEPGGEEQQ